MRRTIAPQDARPAPDGLRFGFQRARQLAGLLRGPFQQGIRGAQPEWFLFELHRQSGECPVLRKQIPEHAHRVAQTRKQLRRVDFFMHLFSQTGPKGQ